MPEYVYRAEDGEEVSRIVPMSRAPKIGAKLNRNGKVFRRVAQLGPGPGICRETRHVAYSLPRKWQWPAIPHDKFDERGRAVFESKRDIEAFQAKVKDRPGYEATYAYNQDSD